MKKVLKSLPGILLVIGFVASCNLPLLKSQNSGGNISPNLTLTALFDTSMNLPPTITPAVPIPTQGTTATTEVTIVLPTANPTETPMAIPTETETDEPIPIPTRTNTSIPPTEEVMQRSGPLMEASYLSTAPVMDGSYAEWLDKTTKYGIPYVVWGKDNWTGVKDLEGAFAAAWDEDYFYISVKVTDDVFAQNETGEFIYKGDSVELLIDANLYGDYYADNLSNDDFQFGISPGNPDKGIDPEVYLWYPASMKGSKSKVLVSSLFETSPIYRVEVGIPWTMLGIDPAKGTHIGFAVSVSDDDKPGENIQQTMISTARYRNFLDPTTWGELVLQKK